MYVEVFTAFVWTPRLPKVSLFLTRNFLVSIQNGCRIVQRDICADAWWCFLLRNPMQKVNEFWVIQFFQLLKIFFGSEPEGLFRNREIFGILDKIDVFFEVSTNLISTVFKKIYNFFLHFSRTCHYFWQMTIQYLVIENFISCSSSLSYCLRRSI